MVDLRKWLDCGVKRMGESCTEAPRNNAHLCLGALAVDPQIRPPSSPIHILNLQSLISHQSRLTILPIPILSSF